MMEVLVTVLAVAVAALLFRLLKDRQRLQRLFLTAEDLQQVCGKLAQLVEELQKENTRLARLEKTHRELNEGFERQAKEAWERFHAAGLAAGAAQSMLLTQLEAAVREINKYRQAEEKKPIEVNPALRGIVEDFKREHMT